MKITTSELIGAALDWAVCLALGNKPVMNPHRFGSVSYGAYESELGYAIKQYHRDWAQGGPIIERERIHVQPAFADAWQAELVFGKQKFGLTPLIAAMRCYCCAKLGDEIDIPEELLQCQPQNN